MPNNAKNIKKSAFNTVTALDATAYLDAVQNNTNVKILLANLIAQFGTTGSLSQTGAVAGTPILSQIGSINYIRNIEDGPGVKAAISPLNSVKLEHNFLQDTTGAEVLTDMTAAQPKFRSIVSGPGINVSVSNGSIQIALSATPASTKTVVVNALTDFPAAVAGVITLEADTQYFLTNDITTSNRFILQANTILSGADGALITLTYTGVGVMFTATDVSAKITDTIVLCETGTLFNVTDTTGTKLFQISSLNISCDIIGTIGGLLLFNSDSVYWKEVYTDGFLFTGNTFIINFFANIGTVDAGEFIDFGTSTFSGFTFNNSQGVIAAGAVFLKGLPASGNVNAGGLASVLNTRAQGVGTPLSGISTTDSLWEFFGNSGMPNSRNTLLAVNAGATVVIAAINTPVIVGAPWTIEENSRFTGTAGGRFTYTGTGAFATFHASITADIPLGTKISCTFYLYKNGVKIANSAIQRDFTAGSAGNFSMLWGTELTTGDYLEVFAENNDTTTDIDILNAIVRID